MGRASRAGRGVVISRAQHELGLQTVTLKGFNHDYGARHSNVNSERSVY